MDSFNREFLFSSNSLHTGSYEYRERAFMASKSEIFNSKNALSSDLAKATIL